MKVLILSNMYPKGDSYFGSFVKEQVMSLEKNGVQIIKVVKTSENKLSYFSFFLRSLYHLLLKDYELVHAHYGFHSALSALIFKRTPLVVTYHRGDALEEPQRNPIYHWLQCLTIKKASHIIAVSQEIKDVLVSKLNANESKVSVISCGVNTGVFKPYEKKGLKVQGFKGSIRKELGLPEDKTIILFPGHLSYRKGIDIVYKCASLLPDVIFVLIGSPKSVSKKSKYYREDTERRNHPAFFGINSKFNSFIHNDLGNFVLSIFRVLFPTGIPPRSEDQRDSESGRGVIKKTVSGQSPNPNNCILVGPVPHSEIPKWLNAADIFFLPSRSEGTPVSLLEALACGVPAITSTAGGIPDVIRNGENGVLIPVPLSLQTHPLSSQAPLLSLRASAKQSHINLIVSKITELVESREKRELMGKKARESIKRFDQQKITDRIKKVYFLTTNGHE